MRTKNERHAGRKKGKASTKKSKITFWLGKYELQVRGKAAEIDVELSDIIRLALNDYFKNN